MRPTSSSAFWIYGLHAIQAALHNPARVCLKLLHLSENALEQLVFTLDRPKMSQEKSDKNAFSKLFSPEAVHQGLALLLQPLATVCLEDLCEQPDSYHRIATLDQVTDPHNLGAIARTAAAFGFKALILPERNSPDINSPVVYKTASGALEHLPLVQVTNLARTLNTLHQSGFWNIGCDEEGDKLVSQVDLGGRLNLVLGSEGHGMRRLTKESCDAIVRLPTSEVFQTLNVSTAAAVVFYEAARQQELK